MIVKLSESPEKESVNTTSATKRMTRLLSGKLFHKDLYIWCMESDESIKKKKIRQNPFYHLKQKKSWTHICARAPFLTDKEMQDRILGIAFFPKDAPGKTNPELTPEVYAIASLLQSPVANK